MIRSAEEERPTSVLVVDDDPGMTETMGDILSDAGFEVGIASDGYLAVEAVSEKEYDIILMDIRMPGIDGVETFKRVKRISPQARVVMMTAFAVEDLIRESCEEGAYAVLYKPFDIDRVFKVLKEAKRGMLVMVVGCDDECSAAIKGTLEEGACTVKVTRDVEEAVMFAGEKSTSITMLEVDMPAAGGYEIYKRIKEADPDITVVMLADDIQAEAVRLIEEGLEKGVYACIQKPLDMKEVMRVVEEISIKRRFGNVEYVRGDRRRW